MNNYIERLKSAKQTSVKLANLDIKIRNLALKKIAEALIKNKESIFRENAKDLDNARKENLSNPIISRLKFDESKLKGVVDGLEGLISLDDPLNKPLLNRHLDDSLFLTKTSCPIGVIGVIFESRPDALIQISSLCIKSGNISILKGGSDAKLTNRILFDLMYQAGLDAGLPENFSILLESRENVDTLLSMDKYVDLLIPRGSNEFVQHIMNNSKIPVLGHADGICHIYVNDLFDIAKIIDIIIDSKTQYVSACNTVETLLIKDSVSEEFLPTLFSRLSEKNVELRGCSKCQKIIKCKPATEDDFKTEYLDYILSAKIVSDLDEAIEHINTYGSHHTDCILTKNENDSKIFSNMVDSANVYWNCSTRFADGFRYGFGAEIGISTSKIHARGPVGLEGLVTYKYNLKGDGNIVSDYASGKKNFHFSDK